MDDPAGLFKLLGDTVRLRILRLLEKERLNVSELTSILGIAQSGVSRHLRLLKEGGLLREDREAGWSYYRVDPSAFPDPVTRAWPLLRQQIEKLDGYADDDARLGEILRHRQEEFRDTTGGVEGRMISPGRSWAAWARALGFLIPPLTVADLGCGEGNLSIEAARWARKVIGIDRSADVLRKARALADKAEVRNIVWKRGEIEDLPLEARSVDVVLLSQALHYAQDPVKALREAERILVPGGKILLLDLRAHREEWVKEKFGDVWLGFEQQQVSGFLKEAGFVDVVLDVGARRRGDPFTVLIGSGTKKK